MPAAVTRQADKERRCTPLCVALMYSVGGGCRDREHAARAQSFPPRLSVIAPYRVRSCRNTRQLFRLHVVDIFPTRKKSVMYTFVAFPLRRRENICLLYTSDAADE